MSMGWQSSGLQIGVYRDLYWKGSDVCSHITSMPRRKADAEMSWQGGPRSMPVKAQVGPVMHSKLLTSWTICNQHEQFLHR